MLRGSSLLYDKELDWSLSIAMTTHQTQVQTSPVPLGRCRSFKSRERYCTHFYLQCQINSHLWLQSARQASSLSAHVCFCFLCFCLRAKGLQSTSCHSCRRIIYHKSSRVWHIYCLIEFLSNCFFVFFKCTSSKIRWNTCESLFWFARGDLIDII